MSAVNALPWPGWHRHALSLPQPPPWRALLHGTLARALRPWSELRIDVDQPTEHIETELQGLHDRLRDPDDLLHRSCRLLPLPLPGLLAWHREADGEHYVYVEDPGAGRLAGTTVFNRLVEVDRRTDRHVRAPHSRYAPAYQRRGIASAVYGWMLARGICLVSGARQSPGAHALWRALARRHPMSHVEIAGGGLHFLGREVPEAVREQLGTRLILLGTGWTLERLPLWLPPAGQD